MDKIKVLELFCGTKSFSKVAEKYGMKTFTSENNKRFKPDYLCNILDFKVENVPFKPDIIWASFPCTCFSVASMWKHWTKDRQPKTLFAECAIEIVKKTLQIVDYFNPPLFYGENPRGMLRHTGLLDHYKRHTVTYCQYGESRMKPTDIWTNDALWVSRPECSTIDKCHTTQTNDLSTPAQRSIVPENLCNEIILSAIENLRRPSALGKLYLAGPGDQGE